MSKTEERYSSVLESRKRIGEIEQWYFESVTLKLADGARYTPDFAVLFPDGSMEFVDTKGGGMIDDKSVVKIKCAAEKFPQFVFAMDIEQRKKDGGGFKRREF